MTFVAKVSTFVLQVIFITEYMSSGSLKQFLKKTKKNHKTMNEKVWELLPIITHAERVEI